MGIQIWQNQKIWKFLMTSSFLGQKRNFAKKCWRHHFFQKFSNFPILCLKMQLWWKFELERITKQGDISIFSFVTSWKCINYRKCSKIVTCMTSQHKKLQYLPVLLIFWAQIFTKVAFLNKESCPQVGLRHFLDPHYGPYYWPQYGPPQKWLEMLPATTWLILVNGFAL